MATTKIFLIRHAEPVSRQGDTALSRWGELQAAKTAERLREEKIILIYASPLARAKQTAQFLANVCGCQIVERPGLEELNWEIWLKEAGSWDFQTARERMEEVPIHEEQGAYLRLAQQKALKQINEIYKENIGRNIAIISHGNVIRSFLTGIMGANVMGFLSLDIALMGISLIEIDEKGHYKILYINDYKHLD